MRLSNSGTIILSPSDAVRFQACDHASALDLEYLRGAPLEPTEDDPNAKLLQAKGLEHEATYLRKLKETGRSVVTIANGAANFADAHGATITAMKSGVDVIYQGALGHGVWQGYSDFLERVDAPSDLGAFSYEPVDTKLKRRADPKHAIQLSIYARSLEAMQGTLPTQAHIVLGDESRVSFKVAEAVHVAGRLAERLATFVDRPHATTPDPIPACQLCRWRDHCKQSWEAADSLVRVAGITRAQRRKLEAAGVRTLEALAGRQDPVPGIAPEVLGRLMTQAGLQFSRRQGKEPSFVLRPAGDGLGLSRLPQPSPGDLFFDMEGDPLLDSGLEYLFGVHHRATATPVFKAWWAHDSSEERSATKDVLAFFCDHLAKYPDAFIYHYNHYEVTALKRLSAKYGVGEHHLDHLLRTERFVDLYKVVRQSLLTSEEGLSIKDLEVFYRPKREEAVSTAAGSIVAYEEWRETRDPKILQQIEDYNRVDCESTEGLRDWLVSQVRPKETPWFSPSGEAPQPEPEDPARVAMRNFIEPARPRLGDRLADLLFELNFFHRRADKPAWWEYFDRQSRDTEELIDDLECLAGLSADAPAIGLSRCYAYPAQETKLRENTRVGVRGSKATATIESIDREQRRITIRFSRTIGRPPETCDLTPGKPLQNEVLRNAVARVTRSMVANDGQFLAIEDFLFRKAPRIDGKASGEPIVSGPDAVTGTIHAVQSLSNGCLPVQGPPGTGKTYVSSCAILALVRSGRRVAVSSNSHKAIDNLLIAVATRAREAEIQISIAKKVSNLDEAPEDPWIYPAQDNDDARLYSAHVVGGTAWLFARPEFEQSFDVLFIDEAGQVSIANLVAMGTAAQNIVLVGDQMQLPQPIQGVHPGESALSTLEYLLEDAQTIAPDRGIFLAVTRRLHPDLCRVISEIVYEGRLSSDARAARHRIDFRDQNIGLPSTGIAFFDVSHEGNSQTSEEEAACLEKTYDCLLGSTFTDRDGNKRPIGIDDILVVSPYNAQVNLLKGRLPAGARVGTVDRFQGQEAPACLISMATSSENEMPRDIEFLFSLNRLNVALSRAQAVAAVFCSPRLLDVSCGSLHKMRLVNAVCAVRKRASPTTMT